MCKVRVDADGIPFLPKSLRHFEEEIPRIYPFGNTSKILGRAPHSRLYAGNVVEISTPTTTPKIASNLGFCPTTIGWTRLPPWTIIVRSRVAQAICPHRHLPSAVGIENLTVANIIPIQEGTFEFFQFSRFRFEMAPEFGENCFNKFISYVTRK